MTEGSGQKKPMFVVNNTFLLAVQLMQMHEDLGIRLAAGEKDVSPWLEKAYGGLMDRFCEDTKPPTLYAYLGQPKEAKSLFDIWVSVGQMMAMMLRFISEDERNQVFGFAKNP